MDFELLDLHDRCYTRQAVVDNAVNRRSRELLQVKCEVAMTEFEKNLTVVALQEKISVLSVEVKEHKLNLDRMMLESQNDEIGSLVGNLVSSAIVYGRCRAFEQVADMKEPFDLSKFLADPSAPFEALLSKKPPTLQRPAPSKTQVPLPSSQRATSSLVPVSNPMSPPADASIMKPQSSQLP
ncbi:hypothetical protein Tco_0546656 [Tanacetum coccineum]